MHGDNSKLFSVVKLGTQTKDVADTRSALTWKAAEGRKTVKARSVAPGGPDPDLRDGNVDIAGCASRRSSHLQLISLSAVKKMEDLDPGR